MPRDAPPDPAVDQDRSFPEAQSVHDRILAAPNEYPGGWVEQARFRERYDLPPFRPPRFRDGDRIDDAVAELSAALGVEIEFVARDVTREGWAVEIDGERAFGFDHHRDDAGNTVAEMTAGEFEEAVERAVRDRG